ncbi:hypothetical protein O6P43_019020 [Quillaja saponaria]|uniref:Uncharacterized protein n=1 Tax=Quillaja saponaria TaxID=32244 RepID=A0AAD7LHI9_QUISA|nr:hypothetical protein O6P43_019020 [Quillaja saponaria]
MMKVHTLQLETWGCYISPDHKAFWTPNEMVNHEGLQQHRWKTKTFVKQSCPTGKISAFDILMCCIFSMFTFKLAQVALLLDELIVVVFAVESAFMCNIVGRADHTTSMGAFETTLMLDRRYSYNQHIFPWFHRTCLRLWLLQVSIQSSPRIRKILGTRNCCLMHGQASRFRVITSLSTGLSGFAIFGVPIRENREGLSYSGTKIYDATLNYKFLILYYLRSFCQGCQFF